MWLKSHITFLEVWWNEQSLIKCDFLVDSLASKVSAGNRRVDDIQRG